MNTDDPNEKKQCLKNTAGISAMETKEHSKRKTNSRRASGLCTYIQLWKAATTLSLSTEDAWILSDPCSLEKLYQKRMLKINHKLERKKEPWKNATDEGKIFGSK